MHALTLDDTLHRDLPAARHGDAAAYGRIVSACQNTVTAIALAITRDVAASEDIAQDACLRAWQQLDRLKNHNSFLPWLQQITRNLARDHLRARSHAAMTGEQAELAIAADPAPQPAEHLLITEQETVAADIIGALPEDSRETLLLYYREGQSSRQVAALLGLSDAAVRKRLSRARDTVREELLQRFGQFARGSAPSAAFTAPLASMISIAAKSAAAATVEVAAGTLGGGMLGKLALGSAGAAGLGAVLGAFLGGGITTWLMRKVLFRFTETPEERNAVWAAYRHYIVVGMVWFGVVLAVAAFTTQAWLFALSVLMSLGAITYEMLVPLRQVMAPLIARDTARAPQTAARRQLAYRLSFGVSAILVTDLAMLVLALPFFLARL